MASMTQQPLWVAPGCVEVTDLRWLAYADAVEKRSPLPRGIVAALEWVLGERDGPPHRAA
jgi:hypothetical protein